MVDINKAVVAKIRKNGKSYEIFVDSERAIKLRRGENISMNDVVATEEIFYDAKKGERASQKDLKNVFGTDDKLEVCRIIVNEGYVPITAELMRDEIENRKKQIINIIHRNVIDPKTQKPHPPQRIEAAISEAKVKIDANKSAEEQVGDVVNAIRTILPIKYETREVSIKIQAQHTGRAFPVMKKYGRVLREDWLSDGSLLVMLEIPGGVQEDLEVDLNKIARGTLEMRVVRAK